MSNKALKITIGGLVILGGYIGAYQYGYVRGLLDLKLAFDEDDQKQRNQKRVSYRSYYSPPKPRKVTYWKPSNDEVYILQSREEAEEVLIQLRDILEKYGRVEVADYKELVGASSSYTENKCGWTDLSNAKIDQKFNGWTVVLPGPKDLY